MPYSVKEIFYTLQGEGTNAGRPAVFCRFSGCNLWSGREEDRLAAACAFCDTDFKGTDGPGGGTFLTAKSLADAVLGRWPKSSTDQRSRFVVLTGGEPTLQVDDKLTEALHGLGFQVAVETNGTRLPPPGVDWITVSPKAGSTLVCTTGDELKLVYPQNGLDPGLFEGLSFGQFLLQPLDGPDRDHSTRLAIEYCLAHPRWRLSLQTHKYIGIR